VILRLGPLSPIGDRILPRLVSRAVGNWQWLGRLLVVCFVALAGVRRAAELQVLRVAHRLVMRKVFGSDSLVVISLVSRSVHMKVDG